MKKILFITYEYPTYTPFGGIAFYYEKLAILLADNGFDVLILTAGYEKVTYKKQPNLFIEFLDCDSIVTFENEVEKWVTYKNDTFDIVELPHYGTVLFNQLKTGKLHNLSKKITVRFHGFSLLSGLNNLNPPRNISLHAYVLGKYFTNRVGLRILKWVNSKYYKLVKNSYRELSYAALADSVSTTSKLLSKYLNVYQPKLNVWAFPNPSQFESIVPIDKSFDKIKISYINRIQLLKGFDLFRDMVVAIDSKKVQIPYEIEFICCGSSNQWNGEFKLESLNKIVDFRGHLKTNEIMKIMMESNIVVVPSRFESFSNVALEAMMNSCIVIVGNNVGIGDYIIHGVNGFVFDTKKKGSLELCVFSILSLNRNELRRISLNAFNSAKELSRNTELLNYYNEIAAS